MTSIRSMSSYEARRATFFEGLEESNKSRKRLNSVWPHPINLTEDALEDDMNGSGSGSSSFSSSSKGKQSKKFPTPSELANLGLYFDSSNQNETDACVLFPEGEIVSGWKAGDDVPKKIREVCPDAALLKIHESKHASNQSDPKKDQWTWKDEDLLPTSKTMIAVRIKTFTSTWPYDGKKGWKPTSKKLSAAGFYYTPNEEEDYCAKCQYCDLVLGGWEKTDDPMHEHERRRPGCPFFNCSLVSSPAEEIVEDVVNSANAARTRSTSTATKRTRAVSKRKAKDDEEIPEQQPDAEEEEVKELEAKEDVPEQPKSRNAGRTKKQATSLEDASMVVLVEAPVKKSINRKASRKIQESENPEMGSKTIIEKPIEEVEKPVEEKEDEEEEDLQMPTSEEKISSEPEPLKTSTPLSKQSMETNSAKDKEERPEADSEKGNEMESQQRTSLKRMSELVPFVISPLKKIRRLTSAEEDMTVESWLKMQVSNACQEMEREGKERIEKLRNQIGKGRVEIEAVLRGKSVNTTS